MGVTGGFVKAEMIITTKLHLYSEDVYRSQPLKALETVYAEIRGTLEYAVDAFIEQQDALLDIRTPRDRRVGLQVGEFDVLASDEYAMIVRNDDAFLQAVRGFWSRFGFDNMRKPTVPMSFEPHCENHAALRTLYDYNVNFLQLRPHVRELASRLERAMDEVEGLTLAQGVLGMYENYVLQRIKFS